MRLFEKVRKNNIEYNKRLDFYKKHGCDFIKDREFILEVSEPFSEPVLEVGTGKGHFALVAAGRKCRCTSVDISPQDQAIARLNLMYHGCDGYVDLKIENAESLSFADKSFSTVFSVNVYHHLKNPLRVLDEMARVLKPGGKIVLSDFTERGMGIINTCHSIEGREHDCLNKNLDDAKGFLEKKGFSFKETSNVCQRVIVFSRKADS